MVLRIFFLVIVLAGCNISNEGDININNKDSNSTPAPAGNGNNDDNTSDPPTTASLSISSPTEGSSVGSTSVEVTGSYEAGATINISSGSSSCSTTALGDASFSCTLSPALPAGANVLSISATTTGGESDSATLNIVVGYTDLCSLPQNITGRVFFNFASDCQFFASVENGWMLWLQYYHEGGTQPASNIISNCNDLPIDDSTLTLGTNHSNDLTKWGHGSQAFAQQIPDANIKLRWFGKTSHHNRIVHFESPILGQFRDSSASHFGPGGIANNFTALAGHTAYLPEYASATHGGGGGDGVLTNVSMWDGLSSGQNAHWSVKDVDGRWFVDSRSGSNNSQGYFEHTIHKIWVGCIY